MSAWDENSPDSLVSICTRFCVKNLETFCELDPWKKRFSLRAGITLPLEICEGMLSARAEDSGVVDDDFVWIFRDPRRTRLRRVNVSNSAITDQGLAVLLRHNLVELDVSDCDMISHESLHLINKMGCDLLSLNIGTSNHIFPDPVVEVEEKLDDLKKAAASASMSMSMSMSTSTSTSVSTSTSTSSSSSSSSTSTSTSTSFKSNSLFYSSCSGCILNTLQLRKLSLRELSLPLVEFFFPLLLKPLVQLTSLDLSGCFNLGSLDYLTHMKQLASLTLYNVPRLQNAINAICQLKMLRHLDISQHIEKYGIYRHPNQLLAQIVENLPRLVSLDISGTNLAGTGIAEHDQSESDRSHDKATNTGASSLRVTDIPGLRSRVNDPLDFLGLFGTSHDACHRHHIPAKRITGDASERQLLTAAHAYLDRADILQKVLNDLFHIVRYDTCYHSRLALDMILAGMQKHLTDKHIQISGSASLFYIVKSEEKKNFNIKIKRKFIKAVLDAMWEHKFDTTMMRNGCLTLCQFKIPQDVLFDYRRLVEILLHIVAEDEQEDFVQRIGIYLLNSLACQVDGTQKQLVGDLGAINIMLRLIDLRLQRQLCDDVMEIAWSTMWNVTDETPLNCLRFLEGGGMNFFLNCLKMFKTREELLRNMMGLLGNVAEVQELRPKLMTEEFISVFNELLDSDCDGIEVSYNAAGVLSHIASDGEQSWTISIPKRSDVLNRMVDAIQNWNIKTRRNINYRSFEPIFRLLCIDHTPEAQLWAVWALANLTCVYPDKYCPLVEEEKGLDILMELIARQKSQNRIAELAMLVIRHCEDYNSNSMTDVAMDNSDMNLI